MESHDRIENTDGILRGDLAKFLKLALTGVVDRSALGLSHAIHDQDQAFFPSGAKIGSRSMRQVMVDVLHAVNGERIQMAMHLRQN